MGLKFDNEKGVCDWEESVVCSPDGNNSESDGSSGEEEKGITYAGEIETVTAFRPMGGSWQGEVGKEEMAAAWSGGSDWGGSWVEGVW